MSGKTGNKVLNRLAAKLETKLGRRTVLSRWLRRRAKSAKKLAKRQDKKNAKEAQKLADAAELRRLQELEVAKYQKAVNLETGQKYWYHKETGEILYENPEEVFARNQDEEAASDSDSMEDESETDSDDSDENDIRLGAIGDSSDSDSSDSSTSSANEATLDDDDTDNNNFYETKQAFNEGHSENVEWETYYDDTGTPYYYNPVTGESTY